MTRPFWLVKYCRQFWQQFIKANSLLMSLSPVPSQSERRRHGKGGGGTGLPHVKRGKQPSNLKYSSKSCLFLRQLKNNNCSWILSKFLRNIFKCFPQLRFLERTTLCSSPSAHLYHPLPKGRQLTDPFQQAATFPRLLLCMQINDGNDVYNSSLEQGEGEGEGEWKGVGSSFIFFIKCCCY